MPENYRPKPIWTQLGAGYSDPVKPADFPMTRLRFRNTPWAKRLGLSQLSDEQWLRYFARFEALPHNQEHPQALRYHGHQFLHYNPDLGDGRGFLYGQVEDPISGRTLDFGTKGSGQTPYSRAGDGRLTLKGAVREILATEMLEALGVNTSKTFSVTETGESLYRGDEPSPTRSAVLVRLSHSHVRIGSFQRLAYLKEKDLMSTLVDYCLRNYFPREPIETSPATTLHRLCSREVAKTGAQWMVHGFVHGVLNTDNINITGESFDYGPYRFLTHYAPAFTAAYFDKEGLYAFGRQPQVLMWNLKQLQKSLELVDGGDFEPSYEVYQKHFQQKVVDGFFDKFGLQKPKDSASGLPLVETALEFLRTSKMNYHQLFYDWFGGKLRESPHNNGSGQAFYNSPAFKPVLEVLQSFEPPPGALENQKERALETLFIDEIENIWSAIDKHDNWAPMEEKVAKLRALNHRPPES